MTENERLQMESDLSDYFGPHYYVVKVYQYRGGPPVRYEIIFDPGITIHRKKEGKRLVASLPIFHLEDWEKVETLATDLRDLKNKIFGYGSRPFFRILGFEFGAAAPHVF
jgi:hypothetical protein